MKPPTDINGFELTRGGIAIPLAKGPQHLLAYLAVHQRSLRRVHVAGVLWADGSDERAAGNLRSALWRLRMAGVDLIGAHRDYLHFSAGVVVDLREANSVAERLLDTAADVKGLALEDLPFGGELLPGWYDDWIVLERERHRQISLHALEALCRRWADTGQFEKAIGAGLAAVAMEPLRESAHTELIKAHLAEGNPSEAMRQFGLYRTVLRNELHLEPSTRLVELISGLTAGRADSSQGAEDGILSGDSRNETRVYALVGKGHIGYI